jgi:signal transduction histidine kinase
MDGALDEPLLPRPRIATWFADRPRIADVLVILACTAPMVAALFLTRPPHAWLGFLSVAVVGVAFWWRRAHPLLVLVIAVTVGSLNPLLWQTPNALEMESVFAVYAVAAWRRPRTAVIGLVLSVVLPAAVLGGARLLLGQGEGIAFGGLQPFVLVALALGVAARTSRLRRAEREQMLSLRIEQAARAERARITAEMHDVVAHSVTVMIALAGGARAGWEKHPERARQALEQLGEVGAQALAEMQRILRVFREGDRDLDRALDASGHNLPPLAELVDVFRSAGLPVAFAHGGEPPEAWLPADPALRTTVYRIVQESLTNALRYAQSASSVRISLAERDGMLVIVVADDGTGATGAPRVADAAGTGRAGTEAVAGGNPGVGEGLGAGVGVRAMRERAAAFGGTLAAGPAARGWRVEARLPLDRDGQERRDAGRDPGAAGGFEEGRDDGMAGGMDVGAVLGADDGTTGGADEGAAGDEAAGGTDDGAVGGGMRRAVPTTARRPAWRVAGTTRRLGATGGGVGGATGGGRT